MLVWGFGTVGDAQNFIPAARMKKPDFSGLFLSNGFAASIANAIRYFQKITF